VDFLGEYDEEVGVWGKMDFLNDGLCEFSKIPSDI
jgi:hypothetical protein